MNGIKIIERKYPCRNEIIKTLFELIGNPDEAFPAAIYLFGHSGTGKTALTKEFIYQIGQYRQFHSAHLNCVECYTTKILLESILEDLKLHQLSVDCNGGNQVTETIRCDSLKDFVEQLRQINSKNGFIIALDNAERLRDMDANVLPTLLRLQQLTGLNVCVVLISQLPFEKFYSKTGLADVIVTLHCAQYSKAETLRILSADFKHARHLLRTRLKYDVQNHVDRDQKLYLIKSMTVDFFNNYLNLFLSVFYKACRDVPELKITAHKCFAVYMEPVLDGNVDSTDVSRLWRHIAGPLRAALSQVYMRLDQTNNKDLIDESLLLDQSVRKLAQSLELPYYGKYLLIAAFLASHNSAKEDKRLFVKHHGKQRKRMATVNVKLKVTEKMSTSLGPKSFSIDRLLAIFYSILEEKVGLTCNLLSQISTLVHLKLLSFVSCENNVMDGSSRLQCTVGLEFVLQIGRVLGFNVRQYLCDFM